MAGKEVAAEPLTILIGALGGEGGGVLTEWLVSAAMARDFPVQSTSIPGVAQRTGATTYYCEIYPVPRAEPGGRRPLLALYPSPGRVDIAVMSEWVEAGRAMENGFVTPDRTLLVASTHRIYSIDEKSAMGDGRFDSDKVGRAARELAREALLFDLAAAAREAGSVLNAVLLGVIAGSGRLPFQPADLERAIHEKGVAVESNLRGFAAGLALVRNTAHATRQARTSEPARIAPAERPEPLPADLRQRMDNELPAEAREFADEGVRRLIDYQGRRYAGLYLERLARVAALDDGAGAPGKAYALTRETARHLALWMSYEDAIRVAHLKTRAERMAQVRAESGAKPGEPVRIVEYLDPSVEEICAVLPPFVARPILALTARWKWLKRWRRPMEVRTDTVSGFLKLWLMARLRPLRPHTYRYAGEQELIARWLEAVMQVAPRDPRLALEVVQCARLIKGYGDTYARGRANFLRIFAALLEPALGAGATGALPPADRLRQAREAALADPEGVALAELLGAGEGAVPAAPSPTQLPPVEKLRAAR